MTTQNKLKKVFAEALDLEEKEISDDLKYHSIPEWDSIAHMSLVATIDDAFNITLSTDDVIALNSFTTAKELLKKYGIKF